MSWRVERGRERKERWGKEGRIGGRRREGAKKGKSEGQNSRRSEGGNGGRSEGGKERRREGTKEGKYVDGNDIVACINVGPEVR